MTIERIEELLEDHAFFCCPEDDWLLDELQEKGLAKLSDKARILLFGLVGYWYEMGDISSSQYHRALKGLGLLRPFRGGVEWSSSTGRMRKARLECRIGGQAYEFDYDALYALQKGEEK